MGSQHEAFLLAVQDDDSSHFLQLMRTHHRHGEDFDVADVIKACDGAQVERMWEGLLSKCSAAVLTYSNHTSEETLHSDEAMTPHHMITEVITVAIATIKQDLNKIPPPLYDTVFLLNGIMLHVLEEDPRLAAHISDVLELWWKKQLDHFETWAPNLLLFSLHICLRPKSTIRSIKRVWGLRECVRQLVWEEDEGQAVWDLINTAVLSPTLIQRQEGRLFLSFVMQEKPDFIEPLYQVIKAQLMACSKSLLAGYSSLFVRIWQDSSGDTRTVVEKNVVQDLMFLAVHVNRRGAGAPATAFRQLLNGFHKQRLLDGIDEMLNRLYAPILWRSLTVTNPVVRANAASVFMDAFPLVDPSSGVDERDKALQRQFDLILETMEDQCPEVRCIGIQGVCRVCNMFWELIPQKTIAVFVTKLVQEHAWDVSCDDARLSVVRGLTLLLDNHLSHSMLAKLLPLSRNMFHDKAEKVRLAYITLLGKVKVIQAIKYWAVVPMEHLLARLASDSLPVCRKLTEMLLSSFMPADKDGAELMSRCQVLWQQNPQAARKFYQHAYKFHRSSFTCRYLDFICALLLSMVKSVDMSLADTSGQLTPCDGEGKENEGDGSLKELGADVSAVAGFLETLVIIRTGINQGLNEEKSHERRNALNNKMSQVISKLFTLYEDERITRALVVLAGFLPPKAVPMVSGGALSRLRKFHAGSSVCEWEPLLEAMCRWNKSHEVLHLVNEWMTPDLDPTGNQKEPSGDTGRRRVGFVEAAPAPQPTLAMSYLTQLMDNIVCQEAVRTSPEAHKALQEVTHTLSKVTVCIEKRLRSTDIVTGLMADDLITQVYDTYLSSQLFLHNKEKEEHDFGDIFKRLLLWSQTHLIPGLTKHKPASDKPRKKQRRALYNTDTTLMSDPTSSAENTLSGSLLTTTEMDFTQPSASVLLDSTLNLTRRNEEDMDANAKLTITLIEKQLSASWNMLMVGIGDCALAQQLANFCLELLNYDEHLVFLPSVVRVINHTITASLSTFTDVTQVGMNEENSFIAGVVAKCVKLLTKLRKTRKSLFNRAMTLIQGSFTDTLQEYYTYYTAYQDCSAQKEPMRAICEAILAELDDSLKQVGEADEVEAYISLNKLPLLSACLMTFITTKMLIVRLFCEELLEMLNFESRCQMSDVLAMVHVVHPLVVKLTEAPTRKRLSAPKELEELLNSLEVKLVEMRSAETEGSSCSRFNEAKTLITLSKTKLCPEE